MDHDVGADPASVSEVELELETMHSATILPVSAALLTGSAEPRVTGRPGDEIRDAPGRVPNLGFGDTDEYDTPRRRWHIEVHVAAEGGSPATDTCRGGRNDGAVDAFYLPAQDSTTASALAGSARARGLPVVRYRDPSDLVAGRPYAWGGPRFMSRLSAHTDLATLEPVDGWLPSLPWALRRRDIRLTRLSEASTETNRAFVKAPREKDFEAGIYTGPELPRSGADDPPVLVSDIVTFTREYRLLVLAGEIHTGSRYLTGGRVDVRPLDEDPDRDAVLAFGRAVLAQAGQTLPSAVTVDVGWAVDANRGDEGWAVVEANMAWFSNIYACDADSALDVVMRSAGPADTVSARDRAFVTVNS